MQIFHKLITFGGSPVVPLFMDVNGNTIFRCMRIYAEPASTNTHVCFVEAAGIATGATGATDGVIKQLGIPSATGVQTVDFWEVAANFGSNILEIAEYQFDGTSGEKLRLTIHVQ